MTGGRYRALSFISGVADEQESPTFARDRILFTCNIVERDLKVYLSSSNDSVVMGAVWISDSPFTVAVIPHLS